MIAGIISFKTWCGGDVYLWGYTFFGGGALFIVYTCGGYCEGFRDSLEVVKIGDLSV